MKFLIILSHSGVPRYTYDTDVSMVTDDLLRRKNVVYRRKKK